MPKKVNIKTTKTEKSVAEFLKEIKDENKRKDCLEVYKIMKTITKSKGKMWGTTIVGFGDFVYKRKSGDYGDWFIIGFAPRAHGLSIYQMGSKNKYPELMKKLGKYKSGVGCLNIKRLGDIDVKVLTQLVTKSYKEFDPEKAFC